MKTLLIILHIKDSSFFSSGRWIRTKKENPCLSHKKQGSLKTTNDSGQITQYKTKKYSPD